MHLGRRDLEQIAQSRPHWSQALMNAHQVARVGKGVLDREENI